MGVLVVIAFFMSRFGLGFRVLQYGYGSNNELEPSLALKIGTSQDHWWLHTVLAYYIIILPSILLSEYFQPEAGKSKLSTDQYPRNTGLAFAGVTIIAGVFMLVQVLIEMCLFIPHNLDTVTVNTRIPLHQPESYLTRKKTSSKMATSSRKNEVGNNDAFYLGQTVHDQFKPARTK